mmetsp:Transcript_10109/g.35412  ORF Transcript_10109/g.35412 Transcript_10109/m.35412 type:complete len:247 (-) Transcript_10109:181-921(-)
MPTCFLLLPPRPAVDDASLMPSSDSATTDRLPLRLRVLLGAGPEMTRSAKTSAAMVRVHKNAPPADCATSRGTSGTVEKRALKRGSPDTSMNTSSVNRIVSPITMSPAQSMVKNVSGLRDVSASCACSSGVTTCPRPLAALTMLAWFTARTRKRYTALGVNSDTSANGSRPSYTVVQSSSALLPSSDAVLRRCHAAMGRVAPGSASTRHCSRMYLYAPPSPGYHRSVARRGSADTHTGGNGGSGGV